MTRGRFITFEGLDGAGKSTQLAWFVERLRERGVSLCATREPGGTPLGERLRSLLLDVRERMDPETETLLMFAARREHIAAVIAPALERGEWVICDRFTDATFAYQGGGRGVPWERLRLLEHWVQRDLQPDLTLYFDVSPEVGQARAGAIKMPDRFESEATEFHGRVRNAYLRRASESGGRIRVLDGGRAVFEIQKELEVIIETL